MKDFQEELLSRTPLAEAVFLLSAHVMEESFLNGLFEANRGQCYERELSFATLVYLIRDALVAAEEGGRRTFERARQAGTLAVSNTATYGKLGRLPEKLSIAFLRQSSARLTGLMPLEAWSAPASLSGMDLYCTDGKVLKHSKHLLAATRSSRGKLLGGKILVAQDMRSGLALAMNAEQEAERNDVPMVSHLLEQVHSDRPILWVNDRQFCDLNLPSRFTQNAGHFLTRFNRTLTFEADPQRPAKEGSDPRGRRYREEWGLIGGKKDPRRRYVRRITLYRPQVKDGDVLLITDLLDEQLYPAGDLLECYLHRWGIEQMFQQVTEVFDLKHLIGSSPKAMIFQSAFCLLLYNMIQVVRGYVARAGKQPVSAVSGEKLFDDVNREMIAWATVGDPEQTTVALSPPLTTPQLRRRLDQLLGSHWNDLWLKSPPRSRPSIGGRTIHVKGGRSSVWKLMQLHKAQKLLKQKHDKQTC